VSHRPSLTRKSHVRTLGTAGHDPDPRRALDANRLHEEAYQRFAIFARGGRSGLPGGMREQRGPASAGNHHYNHQNDCCIARLRSDQQHCRTSTQPVKGTRWVAANEKIFYP
jgi:hypothetical protein